jgi:hypothetical protein
MMLATLTWPDALVISVALAALALVAAVLLWQVFAVVVKDDRQTERDLALRESRQGATDP